MLKSVDSISYSKGSDSHYLVCEHVWQRSHHALESLKATGKNSRLYKTKNLPWFLNGEQSSKAEVLAELEKFKNNSRTKIRLTFCTDESEGFEKAISVRIFPSMAAFERSVFCRRFSYFTDDQKAQHKILTKS